jgi:hypothetical protein
LQRLLAQIGRQVTPVIQLVAVTELSDPHLATLVRTPYGGLSVLSCPFDWCTTLTHCPNLALEEKQKADPARLCRCGIKGRLRGVRVAIIQRRSITTEAQYPDDAPWSVQADAPLQTCSVCTCRCTLSVCVVTTLNGCIRMDNDNLGLPRDRLRNAPMGEGARYAHET